jgi:uncharacterized peroxidase-related enzyme
MDQSTEHAAAPFEVHTVDSAPARSREPLADLERRVGFIPTLAGAMAASPTLIEGFGQLQQSLRGSSLSGLEREVVGLTVSFDNACAYSMAAHSTFAAGHGADAEVLAALRAGKDLPDARLHALHAFTRALLSSKGHLAEAEVAELLAAGYTREQLLEVVAQAAYTTIANWVANLADPPVEGAFAALGGAPAG